jgi:nucleoside recognition membrane protein YjiH
MTSIARLVMQAAPLIGFVAAAVLIKILAARKKIKKVFEVKPLTETEAEESNQGELIGRRGNEEQE